MLASCVALCLFLTGSALAESKPVVTIDESVDSATLSSEEKADVEKTLRRIPLHALGGPHRERVQEILTEPLLYRRGPVEAYPCKPELLDWLVRHPLVVAEFWRQMGLLITELKPLEDGYECFEGNVLHVRFHEVYSGPNLRIVYCTGEAGRPPLPGKLRAEIVYVYRYHFARQPDGHYYVIQQMESFSTAKGAALKALMKLTRSVTNKLVDQSMQDMTIYFSLMCRIMQMRPEWSKQLVEAVRPKHPTADFAKLESILSDLVANPVELPLPLPSEIARGQKEPPAKR